ncbi:MAG: glycosyltransferase family 4 protein [bacterium]
MKIAFLAERLLRGFGADRVGYRLAAGAAAAGHSVVIYAINADGTYSEAPNLEIRKIPIPLDKIHPITEAHTYNRLPWFMQDAARGGKPDLFILCTPPFYLLARWLKPAVILEFGTSPSMGMPPLQKFNFAFMRFTQYRHYFPKAAAILTISHYLKVKLPVELQAKTTVIYPGADHYSAAATRDLRKEFGVPRDACVLLYVGRINPEGQPYKGVLRLIEHIENLRRVTFVPVHLWLAGFGQEGDRRRFENDHTKVFLNADEADMPALYAACDVYVTGTMWEGFDLPLVEAQSFGRPGVAFKVGAHGEVVREEVTGFLATTDKDFANYLKNMAEDADLRQKMGFEAYQWASKFKWKYAVARFLDFLDEFSKQAHR